MIFFQDKTIFLRTREWLYWNGWQRSAVWHDLPACNAHDTWPLKATRWSHPNLHVDLVSQDEAVEIQRFLNKKINACVTCSGSTKKLDALFKRLSRLNFNE